MSKDFNVDFSERDLFTLCLYAGIFESQPLHFICSSTSDGSRVEPYTKCNGMPTCKTSKGAQASGNQVIHSALVF